MAGNIQGGGGGDRFDFYFRRADLDGDGRISGAEAVAFFQGSNLPKQVLAQIWMHADQNGIGFLGRPEFYNALKLVTVAQSKRDLTPDIVKAALYGPAAAKIPPPQINLSAIPQQNAVAISQQNAAAVPSQNAMAAPVPQMRPAAPMQQNLGFRGQVPLTATMNQNYIPTQQNQSMPTRPPLSAGSPASTHAPRPPQQELGKGNSIVGPSTPSSNLSADWFSGKTQSSAAPQDIPRGTSSAVLPVTPPAQNAVLMPVQKGLKDSKMPAVSGNGLVPNSVFGNDVLSAAPSLNKQDVNTVSLSSMTTSTMSPAVPASTGIQSQAKLGSLDSLQTGFTMQPVSSQLQRAPVNPNQHVLAQSSTQPSRISAGPVNSSADQSQMSWPKMKPSDLQKYTKVFVEVDSDRDGKITGEQARNLFMSWRLPREVLKQVWDLADQDNDSMLSLREFCIALYLMERYREGRPLPAALPSNVLFDETLSSSTGLPASSYGNASWGANPGLRQQPGPHHGVPITSAAGLRAPVPPGAPPPSEPVLPDPKKRDSELEEEEDPFAHFGSRKTKPKKVHEEKVREKKVEETANLLMDSKEKIEFYRTMMQELVLYKSRCDNRLNEITERALADKREAESLGKKYEEKYKQVADIASKLTIEEAKFRESQERKMELQQAIIKMEQGGSADGLLQVRADRIQSDVDELMKALTERCKKHGLNINSAALFDLPKGWQPGIQEGAAVWDEEWDKFEDEGFSFAKDSKRDTQNNTSGKSNSVSVLEKGSPESVITASTLDADGKSENLFRDVESVYSPSEDDLERSSHSSPDGRGSPAREFSHNHSRKSTEADAETYRAFDEPSWGNFDGSEDVDSVWGFNPTNTKDLDSENRENYFFGSGDLGSESVRSGSPQSDPVQKKSPFVFADSVPSTPHSNFGNSPPRYAEGSTDHFFDTSSRFDSFSIQDGGYSPRRESLSRFDSVNSSRDFGHDRSFVSFDDADPFGSSGPFKVSSERESSRKDSGSWNAF